MMVLTIIWALGAQERVETLRIEACPSPQQIQAYAASNPMRLDWKLREWTCGAAG